MSAHGDALEMDHPAIARVEDFDRQSGSLPERLLFNNRGIVIAICLLVTAILGYQALDLRLNASFAKMIPTGHPYIANFLAHHDDLKAQGNNIRIAVEAPGATILDPEYLQVLQEINDEVFLYPEVDRAYMKSLWTPTTRWIAVTEEGLDGGTVMPDTYDGSAESLAQLNINISRSGEIGQLVAPDFRSTVILIPLLERNVETGAPIDYRELSDRLEKLRAKYDAKGVRLHIVGFAKVVGDLIEGLRDVLGFFAIACVIATLMVYWYTRCVRSTLLVVFCSLIAVLWQLGLLPIMGFDLDPYSILVPFLVFAIGMSHGAQKMNGVMQDIGRGTHKLVAARYTFRRLFLAGLTALICDAVGFAVLLVIGIRVIQELALIASIGVAVLVFTNLILLPILLSYTGVNAAAAQRALRAEAAEEAGHGKHPLWQFLDLFTHRRWAIRAVVIGLILAGGGLALRADLKVGDLDPGAPELRPSSRYNMDNAYLVGNYATSSDVLVVMVQTPDEACGQYSTLTKLDRLEWQLRQLPGVESTHSLATVAKESMVGMNEGNLRWYELFPNQSMLNAVITRAPRDLFNQSCNLLSVYVHLKDHKADTLTTVVRAVEGYIAAQPASDVKFLLAAGNAGIEAATNIVVDKASREMLLWVYGAVALMCFIAFRSWQAVVVAILPLALTSIIAEALMAVLGIGIKVATLPVIALGVGIGVDYALYILSVMLARLKLGASLSEAYYRALLFTGKVVMLTGFTLAIGVATWAFSPIKFQADMGILLAVMFLLNMLGALILVPALACLLLPRMSPKTIANRPESPSPDVGARYDAVSERG